METLVEQFIQTRHVVQVYHPVGMSGSAVICFVDGCWLETDMPAEKIKDALRTDARWIVVTGTYHSVL